VTVVILTVGAQPREGERRGEESRQEKTGDTSSERVESTEREVGSLCVCVCVFVCVFVCVCCMRACVCVCMCWL
jgi:hypothetical protein